MTLDQNDDTDARLTELARSGDPAAFGQLLRRHDRSLRGLVWTVVGNGPDTDDVLQTAYEKAFRSLGTFAGRSSLRTWLHAICYRAALDHLRYEGRRRHLPLEAVDQTAAPGEVAATVEGRLELARAFALLDPDQRVVLMLTAGLGLSFDEAAEVTGMRRGTVASRASRARRKLDQEMAR